MTLLVISDIQAYTPLRNSRPVLEALAEHLNNKYITPERIQDDFAYYLAAVLRAQVQRSIRTQKIGMKQMKYIYKPLSDKYKETKEKRNKDKFWINTGTLLDNIRIWRTGNQVRVGFKNSDVYPHTNMRLVRVLLYLEKGTKNIPARPLFVPHAKKIMKQISRLFAHFIKFRYGVTL